MISSALRHDASQTCTDSSQSKTISALPTDFEITIGVPAKIIRIKHEIHALVPAACGTPACPLRAGLPVKFKLIAIHRDVNSDSSLRWPQGLRPCQHDKASALEGRS